MAERLLPLRPAAEVLAAAPAGISSDTRDAVAEIVAEVRRDGEAGLLRVAQRVGDVEPGGGWLVERHALERAADALDARDRDVLERVAGRISRFARAQLDCLRGLQVAVAGGRAGHRIEPVARAGCYAPGGRHPLPSSVLMTALTARVAGVREVWVASPRPTRATLAAAAIAGADAVLAIGGAQAIAALAFGAGRVPRCDVVVGPGNRWVTAAKALVAGSVGIDMLAGPSELCVLADGSADAELVAADLLAQAEHDDDARPLLVALDADLPDAVEHELARQLADLPTAATARRALRNGAVTVVGDIAAACAVCDRLAPEHLHVVLEDPEPALALLSNYGALFVGARSAEVFGDYGVGPNHVLPTAGGARWSGGLSVLSFLRVRTWLDLGGTAAIDELVHDCERLAEIEGLTAHARAARLRAGPRGAAGVGPPRPV